MKKIIFIFSIVIGSLFMTPVFGAEIGDNILTNAGFEDNFTNWNSYDPYSINPEISNVVNEGAKSVLFSNGSTSSTFTCLYQMVEYDPTWTTELYMFTRNLTGSPYSDFSVYLTDNDLTSTTTVNYYNWQDNVWEFNEESGLPIAGAKTWSVQNDSYFIQNDIESNLQSTEFNTLYLTICAIQNNSGSNVYLDDINWNITEINGETPPVTDSNSDLHIINTLLLILTFIMGADLLRRIFTPLDKRRGI